MGGAVFVLKMSGRVLRPRGTRGAEPFPSDGGLQSPWFRRMVKSVMDDSMRGMEKNKAPAVPDSNRTAQTKTERPLQNEPFRFLFFYLNDQPAAILFFICSG